MLTRAFAVALAAGCSALVWGQAWGGKAVTVTPAGGQFTANSGEIVFDVPGGAVPTDTILHVLPNRMTAVSPYLLPTSVISIGRPGITFSVPVTMTLKYAPETLPTGTAETSLRVYTLIGRAWKLLGGVVDTVNDTVKVNISSVGTFGLFATTGAIPAENKITFQVTGLTDSKWYRCDPAGGQRESIRDSRITPYPTWLNPTENALYTFFPQPGGGVDLYLANNDNSDPARLTALKFADSNGVAFTPDSSIVALSAKVGTVWRVYRLTASGAGLTILATGGSTGGPAISPNGSTVAFADGNVIKIVNLGTGALVRQFTTALTQVRNLAFNTAGTALAFSAKNGASAAAIYTVPVAGGAPVQRSSAHGDIEPQFSPDGSQILFTRTLTFNGGAGKTGMWRILSGATAADGTLVVPTTVSADFTYFWR